MATRAQDAAQLRLIADERPSATEEGQRLLAAWQQEGADGLVRLGVIEHDDAKWTRLKRAS